MFKLLRYYSAASLVAVLATAVLLTWFYRQVAVEGIVHLAERNNLNLAQVAMNPIKPALLQFLDAAAELGPGSVSPPLPPDLAHSISTVMREESFIARIKIYNRKGMVVFSTIPEQVGDDQSQNEGFITAIRGGVGSKLVYRDTFNSFDGITEEDNLMQTYLPVRAGPTEPIRGVFELYGDVNNLMHQAERTQVIIAAGAILILLALYATLVAIVHHANNTIEEQQRIIRERNETLAALSAHMLKAEELHKQKIAYELHEGVAQTLAGLKLKAESVRYDRTGNAPAGPVDSMIPALQDAIQEVRSIATDLRPAILDDMGLLPTIDWLCREFEQRHADIRIEQRISLDEHDIPLPLKGILYRIIMSVLGDTARPPATGTIRLALRIKKNALILLIDNFASGQPARMDALPGETRPHLEAARMEQLATLSGGAFTSRSLSGGRTTLRAAWEL